ncbi:hypothetical protein [Tautonia sociabilis]|uniref:Phosphatidate cytidylyltransferase n=1 Tax=Tautonia sociabilis TaxID=2080755 RepID=A0A432MD42_9BACT|nr:hypothetical protein [Tautonia sociabilis]RUL81244.1 hypothetical protein TsocGM_25390 [Tautonia sociabilis]
MTGPHDIYDPPPSGTSWVPPRSEPLAFTRGDLACLIALGSLVLAGAAVALTFEALLGVLVLVGGSLVVLESWYTALGFLNRRPTERAWQRVVIILAALVPWLFGLGLAAALMIVLFYLTELGA